jgi:uncharacterized membrane protein YfcA
VSLWPVILGLVLGGVLAAPIAALVVRRLPGRLLMAVVGAVVSLLALRSLLAAVPTAALSGAMPRYCQPVTSASGRSSPAENSVCHRPTSS